MARPADSPASSRGRVVAAAVAAVLVRPSLWPTAVRQAARLTPAGWWRRAPFLPLPDRDYLAFRLETQYGATVEGADPADVVRYLTWCRDQQRALGHRRDGRRR
jgi:hypothetical protein